MNFVDLHKQLHKGRARQKPQYDYLVFDYTCCTGRGLGSWRKWSTSENYKWWQDMDP